MVIVFLGGILEVMDVDHVPVEVLPAVVPLVFDICRSRLSVSAGYPQVQLVVQPRFATAP